jgi:DNA-binding NtrC family response regulator
MRISLRYDAFWSAEWELGKKGSRETVDSAQILVVDDDQDIREALSHSLMEEGYSVVEAEDATSARALLGSNPLPSLIILDYRLPNMLGSEFLTELKSHPVAAVARIPVIVTSAADEAVESMRESEAYLRKPIQLDTLLRVVARTLGNNHP